MLWLHKLLMGLGAIPGHLVSVDRLLRLVLHEAWSSSGRTSEAMMSFIDVGTVVRGWTGHDGRTSRGPGEDMSERQSVSGGRDRNIRIEVTRLDHRSHTRIVELIHTGMAMRNVDNGRKLVLIARVVVVIFVVLLSRDSGNHLELTTENHGKTIASDRLFDGRNTGTITPLVDFTAKSVRFMFEHAELAGREHSVAAGSMYVGNGRIDDGGLGRTTDLGQIRQKGGKILRRKFMRTHETKKEKGWTDEETAIEGLSALSFDCIVSCPAFCSVGTPAGLALGGGGGSGSRISRRGGSVVDRILRRRRRRRRGRFWI